MRRILLTMLVIWLVSGGNANANSALSAKWLGLADTRADQFVEYLNKETSIRFSVTNDLAFLKSVCELPIGIPGTNFNLTANRLKLRQRAVALSVAHLCNVDMRVLQILADYLVDVSEIRAKCKSMMKGASDSVALGTDAKRVFSAAQVMFISSVARCFAKCEGRQTAQLRSFVKDSVRRLKVRIPERDELLRRIQMREPFKYDVDPELASLLAKFGFQAFMYICGEVEMPYMLYVPKGFGARQIPLLLYIPGTGEIGSDLKRQFRSSDLFQIVTEDSFQSQFPCALLVVSPPSNMTTLLGGQPGVPTSNQQHILNLIMDLQSSSNILHIDANRIYLTGFSYGGNAVVGLASAAPKRFAAILSIAGLPPSEDAVAREWPGNWWFFYNDGDYQRHGLSASDYDEFKNTVIKHGGDVRVSSYPEGGHNAWSKAWKETTVWSWMFSKSLSPKITKPWAKESRTFIERFSLRDAKITATVTGFENSVPECAIDGLDGTAYVSSSPWGKKDYWRMDFAKPIAGEVCVCTGWLDGTRRMSDCIVEISEDGKKWVRGGRMKDDSGMLVFARHTTMCALRIRSASSSAQVVVIRRVEVRKLETQK